MHLRHGNFKMNYSLLGQCINSTDRIKDLGMAVTDSMKFSVHCSEISKKANQILGFIKSSITSRSKEVILPLYRGLVRPHLEYAVQLWSPHLIKDIEIIERVQRRATRLIGSMRGKNYLQRLGQLGMYSLNKRRRRGDLIEAFKIIKGKEFISYLFEIDHNSRTRGHNLKLKKTRSRLHLRHYFFSQRVVNDWNMLPREINDLNTVREFKHFIDGVPPISIMN